MRKFSTLLFAFFITASPINADLTSEQIQMVDDLLSLLPDLSYEAEDDMPVLGNPLAGGEVWRSKAEIRRSIVETKSLGLEPWTDESKLFFTPQKKTLLLNLIQKMTFLKKLALVSFDFEEVPSQVFDLTELIELDLSNNNLSGLPHQLCQMVYIKDLYLCDNNFKVLPEAIAMLLDSSVDFQLFLQGNPLYQNSFGSFWGSEKLREIYGTKIIFSEVSLNDSIDTLRASLTSNIDLESEGSEEEVWPFELEEENDENAGFNVRGNVRFESSFNSRSEFFFEH